MRSVSPHPHACIEARIEAGNVNIVNLIKDCKFDKIIQYSFQEKGETEAETFKQIEKQNKFLQLLLDAKKKD